jgi:hypothetical protein
MTEVSLHRVISYLKLLRYPVTIQTVKQQLEYLHLPLGESVTLLHMIPFCLADQHDNIMIGLFTFVTFIYRRFPELSFTSLARFLKSFGGNDTSAGVRRSHLTTRLKRQSVQFSIVGACYAQQNDIPFFEIVREERYACRRSA